MGTKLMNNIKIKNQLIYLITLLLLILPICSSTANSIIKENQLSNQYIQDGANCLINKQYKEALEYFNQAAKLTPKNGIIYFNKGIALDKLGKYQEAISEFDKALEFFNDISNKKTRGKFLTTLNRQALSLISLNRYEEALNNYNKVIELNSLNFRAYIGKGDVLYHLKRYNEAINEYDIVLSMLPNDNIKTEHLFGVYNNKGVAFLALGRYEEAIDNYNKAIEFEPDHIEANANKLCPLLKLGRYQEVVETADKILELDPKNQKAINAKKQALKKLDKL
jgi:tetratricopeptide (TPR) repeat protein